MKPLFRSRALSRLLPALLALAFAVHAAADPIVPPDIINYQGRVLQNGANFNGSGQFKFMLRNETPGFSSASIVWKNDGTLTDVEPATSVTLTVQDGFFSVGLGDTDVAGMARALPADAFGPPPGASDHRALRLRIWFRPGTTGSFVLFTPDVTVNSVPFAFNARTVGGVAAADVVTQGTALAITQTKAGVLSPNTGLDASVTAQHGVAGMTFLRTPLRLAKTFSGDWSFAVLSDTDSSVSFFNLNDGPDSLVRSAVVRDGVGGFTRMASPTDLCVLGNKVYITSATEAAVTLLNFEGTSAVATLRADLVDETNGLTKLNGASAVAAWSSTLLNSHEVIAVASSTENTISLIDVNVPTTPVLLKVIDASTAPGFSGPTGLKVMVKSDGTTFLYAACLPANAVFAFDVSLPASASLLWSRTNAAFGFSFMTGPARFASTSYLNAAEALVVVCPAGNAVGIIDSETGAIFSSIVNGSAPFSSMLVPLGAYLDNRVLAVAAAGSSAITVVDLADLKKPRLLQVITDGVGTFNLLGGCNDAAILAPIGGGTVRLVATGRTDNAVTVTDGFPGAGFRAISATTSADLGVGTTRPHTRIEAFESFGDCAIRAAASASNNASLQLLEYNPTDQEIPFGFEWRYDGGANNLQLITIGHAGAGTKATFSTTGNLTITGTLTQGSDRNIKEHITPVDPSSVLEKVAALPTSEWSYIGDDGVRHLGPMSQDFKAAFNLGATDKGIAAVDADGVALTAIKALKTEMDALKKENEALRQRLQQLEAASAAK